MDGSVVVHIQEWRRGGDPEDFAEDAALTMSTGRYYSLPLLSLSPLGGFFLELVNPRPSPSAADQVMLDTKFVDGRAAFSSVFDVGSVFDVDQRFTATLYTLLGPDRERMLLTARLADVEVSRWRAGELEFWRGLKFKARRSRAPRPPRQASNDLVEDGAAEPGEPSAAEGEAAAVGANALADGEPSSASESEAEEALQEQDHRMADYIAWLRAQEEDAPPPPDTMDGLVAMADAGAHPLDDNAEHELDVWHDFAEAADWDGGDEDRAGSDVASEPSDIGDVGDVADMGDVGPGAGGPEVAPDADEMAAPPSPLVPPPAPAAEAAAIPAPRAPGFHDGPRLAMPRVDWADGGAMHSIRYNAIDGDMIAYCGHHGQMCRRTKTCKAGRKFGSGRPVGFLVAWLKAHAADKASHCVAQPCDFIFEDRSAARAEFAALPGAQLLLNFERPPFDGEGDEPPVVQSDVLPCLEWCVSWRCSGLAKHSPPCPPVVRAKSCCRC